VETLAALFFTRSAEIFDQRQDTHRGCRATYLSFQDKISNILALRVNLRVQIFAHADNYPDRGGVYPGA